MTENNYSKSSRKRLKGVVISDKASKTRVVEVERHVRHPLYKKVLKKKKKYYAHDEKEISAMGDLVTIEEMRPMSKLKRWRIIYNKEEAK
ncbi:MAG: 30S ribosomal protein S17 [Elusimicrobia bacterium]|nr:30S ribosomal protein S17 [Elusimicrobiota bacterium]